MMMNKLQFFISKFFSPQLFVAVVTLSSMMGSWGLTAGYSQEPAKYRSSELLGVVPGVTKLADLNNNPNFGTPRSKEKAGNYDAYLYELNGAETIKYAQFLVKNDLIEVIIIQPEYPQKIETVREAFQDTIKGIRTITIQDSEGNFREVYPDIGFSFIFKKDEANPGQQTNLVTQMMIEKINPDFFLVRAYESWRKLFSDTTIAQMKTDAETVLELDPSNGSAYWLLGMADYFAGNYEAAREKLVQAVKLNDKVPEYHFLTMAVLEKTKKIEEGLKYLEGCREICSTNPLHSAQLAIIESSLIAKKNEPNFDQSIQKLQQVISDLKLLADDQTKQELERLQARELMADAYVVLGTSIAAKDWPIEEKEKSFLWFKSAKLSLTKILNDDPSVIIRILDLYQTASETAQILPENSDIDSFISQLSEIADAYLKNGIDSAEEEIIRLRVGAAFFNAFIASDLRGNNQMLEKYAREAAKYLEPCLAADSNRTEFFVGSQVNYELGTILNEDKAMRKSASRLLSRAAKMISETIKFDGSIEEGDQGIRLVNIGKACWEMGERKQALELTRLGVEAIEKGVELGTVPKDQFSVPCENLIAIYKALGDSANADIYTEKLQSLLETDQESN